jgi:myo-inositol-1(or 4)-monophosphatase
MNNDDYLKIAQEVTSKVADYMRAEFAKRTSYTQKHPESNEPMEWAIPEDLEAHKIYEEFLDEKTPDINLYSEEGKHTLTDKTWVVDPIEGSTNYYSHIPLCATQMSLVIEGIPVVSVINMPFLNSVLHAVTGQGAFHNGTPITPPKHFNEKPIIGITRGGSNDNYTYLFSKLSSYAGHLRVYGATGVDLSLVITGDIHAAVNKGSHIYDMFPGIHILREAGGTVLNAEGIEWSITDRSFIAGYGTIVTDIKNLID